MIEPRILEGFEFFNDVPALVLEQIASETVRCEYQTGQYLFRENEPAEQLFLLESGEVAIMMEGASEDQLWVSELGAGNSIGWSALVPPHAFTASAKATLEPCVVIEVSAEAIERACSREPTAWRIIMANVLGVTSQRVKTLRLQLVMQDWNQKMTQGTSGSKSRVA